MVLADILSIFLRVCELIFSIIVIALTSSWLHHHGLTTESLPRFVYTIAMAAVSIVFSLVFIIPAWGSILQWPVDLGLFIANMVAFGLLVHYTSHACGNVWDLNGVLHRTECGKYKSDISFVFLASIFFLASGLLGLHIGVSRAKAGLRANQEGNGERRSWYTGRG